MTTMPTDTRTQLQAFIDSNQEKALTCPVKALAVKKARKKLQLSLDEEQ
jgi:hypothetical protein